jgi:5'-nucleotidase
VSNFLEGFLKKEQLWKGNIHVVSNRFVFDEKGVTTGYDESLIIHTYNKDEKALKGSPYSSLVASRKNVILIGDTLGDATMADGLQHNCVLKVGFLNENQEENLSHYEKTFDVVILHDGPFDFVNELLDDLLP